MDMDAQDHTTTMKVVQIDDAYEYTVTFESLFTDAPKSVRDATDLQWATRNAAHDALQWFAELDELRDMADNMTGHDGFARAYTAYLASVMTAVYEEGLLAGMHGYDLFVKCIHAAVICNGSFVRHLADDINSLLEEE